MTRVDPKYAWSNKGAALTNLGNYDEAIKACDEAIRLDPKSAIAWDVKGIAIWNQGDSADAINAFNEAIRLDPNNSEFWHHKGIVLKALGRTTEADACLCQSRRATRI